MIRIVRSILLICLFLPVIGCSQVSGSSGASTATMQPVVSVDETASPTPSKAIATPTVLVKVKPPMTTIQPPGTMATPKLNGTLYLWMYRYLEPLYTRLDLSTSDIPFFLELRASPNVIVSKDKITVGLAFAPYSPLVAYMTKTSKSADLWLADLNLERNEHVWRNDREWLEPITDPGDVNIKWGPSDSSLLVSSYLFEKHLVLYSLKTKRTIEASGACNQVAPLPDSSQLTVWCSFDQGAPSSYGFFALDGDIVLTNVKPDPGIEVFEWSFAPGSNRLAYTPKQGNVTIAENRENKLEIPIRMLSDPGDFRNQPLLKWSENGDRLLVYGHNQEHCPLRENASSGNLEDKVCWLVINSETGEILWGPNQNAAEFQEVTGFPLEISFSSCAGLSPNNDWLALCYQSGAITDFVLVGMNNDGKVLEFGSGNIMDFKWVDR
jgi:hypothetical protein